MKSRWTGYLIAVVSIIINYVVFYCLAKVFGSTIPHFIAISLTSAVLIHELGHLIAFEANGIPAMMIFLIVIGGTAPLFGCQDKFKKLSWERQASVMIAGVLGNLAMIAIAYLFFPAYITQDELLRIMNLNGILIMWNLFPIGKFDGGRFSKLLFDSISENRDTKFEIGLTIGFFCIIILILILCGRFNFLYLLLFFWGLHYQATNDDVSGSHSRQAIPESRQKWWAFLFLFLISAGIVILSTTPDWLKNP